MINNQMKQALLAAAPEARHTFHITTPNRTKKQGLIKSFLSIRIIGQLERNISARDGRSFVLYKEQELKMEYGKQGIMELKCVVSFQEYDDGERFAVARLWKPDLRKQPEEGKKE